MAIKLNTKFFIILTLLLSSASLLAADDNKKIKVMTYNLYIGADLKPILETLTRDDFNDELVSALKKIAANRFQDRAQRQAAIIAREKPDVIALQEVWRFQCADAFISSGNQGCNNPSIKGVFVDYLDELLNALKSQGMKYRAVSRVKNMDFSVIKQTGFPAGIPFDIDGSIGVLTGSDRDVILVKSGISARAVNFEPACPGRVSVNGCIYDLLLSTLTPMGDITILHGFIGADVRVGKKSYRIVNTHLEQRDPAPFIQADQADELIQTLRRTTPPGRALLLLGDMNSSPIDDDLPGITPPYQQFADAGFNDAWSLRRRVTPGYTCCQAENLLNRVSRLRDRIDFIFTQQRAKSGKVHLVGTRRSDKTSRPRLWPSDHAGIVAELQF